MWKNFFIDFGRRFLFEFFVKKIVPEQDKLKKEFREYKEKRGKEWEEENGEAIFRSYPMMSEFYATVAPICKFFFVFIVAMFFAIMIFMFFYSVFDRGWNATIIDLRQLWENTNWHHGAGLLFAFIGIGVFVYVPPLLNAYMKQTEVFFGRYGIGVFRFLSREKSATYEELCKYIKRYKICIKNGRYYIPCKGADISVSMIGGAFPCELFELLERKCNLVLPDEDYKNRARISGLGWACGHLGGGILLFFAMIVSLVVFVFEGEFTTMKLLHDLYVNPAVWASVFFVGIGFVCNLFIIPLTAWAYRKWRKVIRVSLLPLFVDVLIVALAFGAYVNLEDMVAKFDREEKVRKEAEVEQTCEQGDQSFIRAFCRDVWGKEFEEVTPEEFAQVKYICADYYEAETNGIRYSMVDYKDCASEEEFLESICIWKNDTEEVIKSPADISMLTGLTYVENPKDVSLASSILPSENQITRMKLWESPKALEGVASPEQIEMLSVDYSYGENEFDFLEQFSNLKQLEYHYRGKERDIDLSKLTCMGSLEELTLTNTGDYVNLVALKDAENLRKFSIDKPSLQQCDFVVNMKDMEELSLGYSPNADLSILTQLPKLKRLCFGNYGGLEKGIADVSQLEDLKELKYLKVSVNESEVSDLVTVLKDRLEGLEITVLQFGSFSDATGESSGFDLSILAQMGKLRKLKVRFKDHADAYGLEALTTMDQLEDLSLIGKIPFNAEILLDKNKLTDNHSVKTIRFSGCEIKSPEGEMIPVDEFFTCFKEVQTLELSDRQ